MLRKKLNLLLALSCLFNIMLLLGLTLSERPARAATKEVYKSEVVTTASLQVTLDQRAAEGWQLVTASAYSPGMADLTVLIFRKQ